MKLTSVSLRVPSVELQVPFSCTLKEFLEIFIMIALRFCHRFSLAAPITKKSLAITSIRGRPSIISCIRRCHSSGAELMPNCILFHRYRPNGVLKVVRKLDYSASTTCQKPVVASNTEKTLALVTRVDTSSSVGNALVVRTLNGFIQIQRIYTKS